MSLSPEPMLVGSPGTSPRQHQAHYYGGAAAAAHGALHGHAAYSTPETGAKTANDFMPSFLLGSSDRRPVAPARGASSLLRTGSLRYDTFGRRDSAYAGGRQSFYGAPAAEDDSPGGDFGSSQRRSCLKTPGSKTPGARVHWAEDGSSRLASQSATRRAELKGTAGQRQTAHGLSSPPTRTYHDTTGGERGASQRLFATAGQPTIESSRNFDTSFGVDSSSPPSDCVDSRWVTVFGFAPSASAGVLGRLSQLAPVRRHVADAHGGNWMHVKLASAADASRVLAKSGMVLPGGRVKIGVEMCTDTELIERANTEESMAANESVSMYSSGTAAGDRPPLQSMLVHNSGTGAKRSLDDCMAFGAASPQLVYEARGDVGGDTKRRRSTARPLAMSPLRLDDSRNASPFAEPDRLNDSVVSRALSYLIGK